MIALRRDTVLAGVFLLGCGAALLFRWYIFLYEAPPPGASAGREALLALWQALPAGEHGWFALQAFLPVACVAVGLAFLVGLARDHRSTVSLAGLCLLLAVCAFALAEWLVAAVLACIAYFTWRVARVA
jgi:hypothetical protein